MKWGSFACFLTAVSVIMVEAAMPSAVSAGQSNGVAGVVQDEIDKNHDKETIKEIKDFSINFINPKENYFVGDKLKYDVTYVPVDTSFKNINYKISDTSLLSINPIDKEISFLKAGQASLTFSSEKVPSLSHNFTFEIQNIEASSIKIKSEIKELNIGDTKTIEYEILPTNTTIKDVIFESSNPQIISVSKDGTIKALKGGKSTIKVSLKENPSISSSIEIKVLEEFHEDVKTIKIPSLKMFNNETKEFYGEYNPISSAFDLTKLKLETPYENLTFKASKIDRSKGRFYFKFTYKDVELLEEKTLNLKFDYLGIKIDTNLIISPQYFLSENLIDTNKLKLNLTGNIVDSSYYSLPKKYIEQITINIPFTQEVTKNTAKYRLKDFGIEFSNDIKVISSSYNKIVIEKIEDVKGDSTLKYFFNKNDKESFLEFKINYKIVTSDEHISDIKLTKFFGENKPVELLLGNTYKSIFEHKIETISLGEKSEGPLNKSPIDIDISEDSKDVISLTKDKNNNVTSITTNKLGEATLIVTSRIENSLNFNSGIKKLYKVKVLDKPNNSYLTIDSNKYHKEDLTIKKGDNIETKLNFEFITTFADETREIIPVENINYDVTFEENDIISFNDKTFVFSALKGGKLPITFKPQDSSCSSLSKKLNLIIDHVAIDSNEFKPNFELISSPEFNKPSDDFSIVPLSSSFKLNAIMNEDATNKELVFHSSDNDVININQSTGVAIAKKVGKATLSIISKDDPSLKITKTIDVINTSSPFTINNDSLKALKFEEIKNKDGKFSHYHICLNYGQGYNLKINTSLKEASSKSIKYLYEDSKGEASSLDIVSIDKEGNISTKGIGSTWVKVIYGDNQINEYSKLINFEVYRDQKMSFKDMAYKLRKLIGHFGLFAATAVSGLLFIFLQFKGKKLQTIILFIYTALGFFVSLISELIQGLIPGRYYTIDDVMLNTFGFSAVTITIIIVLLILILIEHFKNRINEKKTLELICSKEDENNNNI